VQTVPDVVKDKEGFLRLWYHECLRVFSDRLVSQDDRTWFQRMMAEKIKEHFSLEFRRVVPNPDAVIFGNFIDPKAVHKVRHASLMWSRIWVRRPLVGLIPVDVMFHASDGLVCVTKPARVWVDPSRCTRRSTT
jgi:hypothetical protein